jgi:predicted SnoaL-like aldol condensation-catalyzing enzyme
MKSVIAAAGALALLATAAHAAETPEEKANKATVLKFWDEVFDHRDVSKAKLYIDPGYIQHNPNAAQGLAGFEAYFGKVWPTPLPEDKVKPTTFALVMAEDDLVTVVQRQPKPDPDHPGQTYDSYWFDTLRLKNGKFVEHWDNALKPAK